jgi:hypothetical protein
MEVAVGKHVSSRGVVGLEVEFRIGSRRGGKFVPGVDKRSFEAVKSALEASAAFVSSGERVSVDYFFKHRKGRLGGDGGWTTKDVLFVDDGAPTVRGSVAVETVTPPPSDVDSKKSEFFRKKTRTSFSWKTLPWTVDMTRVECNEDPDAEDECFEIEVELDPSAVFYAPLEHLIRHGRSIASDLSSIAERSIV